MKFLKNSFLIAFSLLLFACNSYGEKLQYQKTEVYFTDKVEKAEAEKLGNYLVSSGFADENEKSIQLSKNEENGNNEAIFKMYANQISDSVFNKQPVDFHVCNNTFETLKVISFENR